MAGNGLLHEAVRSFEAAVGQTRGIEALQQIGRQGPAAGGQGMDMTVGACARIKQNADDFGRIQGKFKGCAGRALDLAVRTRAGGRGQLLIGIGPGFQQSVQQGRRGFFCDFIEKRGSSFAICSGE